MMDKYKSIKMEADNLIRLSVYYLNKNGFFKGLVSGDIFVICDGVENSYYILVSTLNRNAPYAHFSYASLQPNGEYKDFGYYVDLVTTPCRYGGRRFWFLCPLTVNGVYCGKRIGVLYMRDGYLGCRNCHCLTYKSRKVSSIAKIFARLDASNARIRRKLKKTQEYYDKFMQKERRFIDEAQRHRLDSSG